MASKGQESVRKCWRPLCVRVTFEKVISLSSPSRPRPHTRPPHWGWAAWAVRRRGAVCCLCRGYQNRSTCTGSNGADPIGYVSGPSPRASPEIQRRRCKSGHLVVLGRHLERDPGFRGGTRPHNLSAVKYSYVCEPATPIEKFPFSRTNSIASSRLSSTSWSLGKPCIYGSWSRPEPGPGRPGCTGS